MPPNSEPAICEAAAWSVRVAVAPEYAALMHVGNIEFGRLFDEARLAFNRFVVGAMRGPEHFSDQVIVRIVIDFRREMLWREEIEIGAQVSRVGRTSYDLYLTIFEDGACVADCTTVSVWMHEGRPAPITDEGRALLARYAAVAA